MSSTKAWMCGQVRTPSCWTRRPSAAVRAASAAEMDDDPAGLETGVGVGGEFGFDADHLYAGPGQLDRRRQAAQQAAAGDRGEDGLHVGACSRISRPMVPVPAMIGS